MEISMYAYCLDMPGNTEEMAMRVDGGVGPEPIDGLIAHVSGPYRDGWRIIDVWESEAHEQRFNAERLVPAVARATEGIAPPPMPFETRSIIGVDALCRR
jgi:hypothetical protein